MNKQNILVIATIALAAAFYFIYQVATKEDAPSNGASIEASSQNEQFTTEPARGDSVSRIQSATKNSKDNGAILTEATSNEYDYLDTLTKVSELQKELIKLGYFIPPEYVASYESYTEDALLQLAEYGDMVAINALKNRYSKEEQWEAYREMQEEAVLQGSIQDISDLHDIEFSKYSGEDSRDRLIKSAAYAELAGLRGSDVSVYYAITNFDENGIEFSPSELAQINQMAKDMLNQINVKRRDRGKNALVEIDDSQLINFEPNASRSGWGQEYVVTRQK